MLINKRKIVANTINKTLVYLFLTEASDLNARGSRIITCKDINLSAMIRSLILIRYTNNQYDKDKQLTISRLSSKLFIFIAMEFHTIIINMPPKPFNFCTNES